MKLLLITAVMEYKSEIQKMLRTAQVKQYSYREVTGYRDASLDAVETNWFGSEINENESVVFYAFVEKESVSKLFDAVTDFNTHKKTLSGIHVASFAVESYN